MPMTRQRDKEFMMIALEQARIGLVAGEVPVGAIVVVESTVAGAAHNRPISLSDPTAHAEVLAIREAAGRLGTYRLTDATLYTTLEPCAMCAGAMVLARIDRLIYAAADPKAGAAGSVQDLCNDARLNHRFPVQQGLRAEESSALLKEFFKARRSSP
jgi:tRNA(adenine34) deaminase